MTSCYIDSVSNAKKSQSCYKISIVFHSKSIYKKSYHLSYKVRFFGGTPIFSEILYTWNQTFCENNRS